MYAMHSSDIPALPPALCYFPRLRYFGDRALLTSSRLTSQSSMLKPQKTRGPPGARAACARGAPQGTLLAPRIAPILLWWCVRLSRDTVSQLARLGLFALGWIRLTSVSPRYQCGVGDCCLPRHLRLTSHSRPHAARQRCALLLSTVCVLSNMRSSRREL